MQSSEQALKSIVKKQHEEIIRLSNIENNIRKKIDIYKEQRRIAKSEKRDFTYRYLGKKILELSEFLGE